MKILRLLARIMCFIARVPWPPTPEVPKQPAKNPDPTSTTEWPVPRQYRERFCELWDAMLATPSTQTRVRFWDFVKQRVQEHSRDHPGTLSAAVEWNGAFPKLQLTIPGERPLVMSDSAVVPGTLQPSPSVAAMRTKRSTGRIVATATTPPPPDEPPSLIV